MIDLTHDKTYRFLILLFLAVIALSSVLVVIELHRARVVAINCGSIENQLLLSNGKFINTEPYILTSC